MRLTLWVVAVALAGSTITGCSQPASGDGAPDAVLTEHRFTPGGAGRLTIGQDCSDEGRDACATSLCVHHRATERGRGFICSARCADDSGCPSGWFCRSIFPGPPASNSYCFPPDSWVPTAVALPAGSLPVASEKGAGQR